MALRTRREAGFSLLEVMISLSILAFGMLALTVGQMSAMKSSRESRTGATAMNLAREALEDLQSMPSADVVAAASAPTYPNDPANPIDPDPGDGDTMVFQRRWFIQPDTPEAGMIALRVEVDWVDYRGFTRTTTIESVKADL